MILYLTSKAHINLLDFIEQEQELPLKKLCGQFSLLSFVVKDMRHFSHVRYVVLDRTAFMESDEEMVQALLSFQTMYEMRIIVIAEGLPESSPFLQQLVQVSIWNVVTADEIKDIQEEIRQCLSYDGMQRFKPTMHTIPFEDMSLAPFMKEEELYRFSCTNITIAIAGCDRRVGVTTTAFNLVCWINAHGGTACYLEANTSNHLAHIVHMFKPEKIGNAYVMEGHDFYLTRELNRGYNFIVVDCGVLREQHLQKSFVDADIRLLCGSAMPYELARFYRAMERCKDLPIQALGLFVPDNMRPYLIETISQNILFGEGSHDLFDSNTNGEVFRSLLKAHIVI